MKLKQGAVELVSALSRRRIDDSAKRTPVAGQIVVGDDLNFLHGFQRQLLRPIELEGKGHLASIQLQIVGKRLLAVDGKTDSARGRV